MGDSGFRLVCDWRGLNTITIKDEACLPKINDLFDTIQGSKSFRSWIGDQDITRSVYEKMSLTSLPILSNGFWLV